MDPRTYLFVPADRPERFAKALASGADAVVLDLEDAVASERKPAARDAIATWASAATEAEKDRIVVRTNAAHTTEFGEDMRLLRDARLPLAMLAKAETPGHIGAVRSASPVTRVLALIESARGVANAEALAASQGVRRLVFGTLDFALDLDLDIAEQADGLAYAASRLVLASRNADLPGPVAGVTPQIDDEARLLADLAWARRLGMGAKLCIHPRQVAAIHLALAPSAQALDWARRVLAAAAGSATGALQLDGRMIDRPVILNAQRTLQRAGQ
ncbi:CoA ester lyase [Pelomonas sp. KK5]|uniref:HpcH/HpaI aldolase/citrate lyase family protein n=1 Tax=Pelomonas sp. KK5 TaxID=1855730 RepID=UPI00097BF9C3|nr:CoA ester lyase [Pelomonas sp. KK5]